MVDIKKLKEPVAIKMEQYECEECGKKFYMNTEDKYKDYYSCPFCGSKAKNVRIFDIDIKAIGEY